MRDFYQYLRTERRLTQRQHDLLVFLLDDMAGFTLHDLVTLPKNAVLYRQVSERTARRDIQHLLKERIIQQTPDQRYELNFHLLG